MLWEDACVIPWFVCWRFAAFGRNARVGALSTRMAAAIPKVPFDGAAVTGPSGPTLPGDGDLDFLEAKP
jgi:hypothetical protein